MYLDLKIAFPLSFWLFAKRTCCAEPVFAEGDLMISTVVDLEPRDSRTIQGNTGSGRTFLIEQAPAITPTCEK